MKNLYKKGIYLRSYFDQSPNNTVEQRRMIPKLKKQHKTTFALKQKQRLFNTDNLDRSTVFASNTSHVVIVILYMV